MEVSAVLWGRSGATSPDTARKMEKGSGLPRCVAVLLLSRPCRMIAEEMYRSDVCSRQTCPLSSDAGVACALGL